MRRILCAAAAVLLLTACNPVATKPAAKSEGCARADSLTTGLLPAYDQGGDADGPFTRTVNPCLDFLDITSTVVGLVPESSRRTGFEAFRDKLSKVTDRLSQVKDVIQCGYQRDRLAVGIYQSRKTVWSVGMVVVIRGDVDAFLDVSTCFLGKLIDDYICLGGCGGGYLPVEVTLSPCFDFAHTTRGSQSYTLLWVASSNTLCANFQNLRDASHPIQAEVAAGPRLVMRSGPGTTFDRVGAVDHGATVYIDCYREGDEVAARGTTSTHWDRVTRDGVTGYLADAWLDSEDQAYLLACR